MNTVVGIGHKAHTALEASGRVARPLAEFPDAPYFSAAGEIIWIGSRLPARHPRAVLTAQPVARGREATFGALPGCAWMRALPAAGDVDAPAVRAAGRRLIGAARALGAPRGFGTLLFRRAPEFPLDFAVPRVFALATAYAVDDPEAVHAASRVLLGVGAGLTPSGDDLAGAALFGRMLVDRREAWREVGSILAHAARTASHAVSAALLADLVAGETFEPLHALAEALCDANDAGATEAAQALTALGHASGWDMLTGCLIGILGRWTQADG